MSARALCLVIAGVALGFATNAAAQECGDGADCPAGYACVGYYQTCPECPPDQVCDPCDPAAEVSYCEIVPVMCDSDADCDEGLICVHFSGESCPGMEPCHIDDSDCSTEPAPCEVVDESYCAPPYVAPCVEDADCGAGFTCESAEACTCVVYPDPGDGSPPPPEECTCEASGETYCALTYQSCTADADCPEGLICTTGAASDAAPCTVDENGNQDCPEPIDSAPFCAPPGYVTPLPLEGDDVTAERTDDPAGGEGEGEGEGESEDGGCTSSQTGGAPPWAALLVGTLLLRALRRRR